jgi:DnaJ-class molecular chaperone
MCQAFGVVGDAAKRSRYDQGEDLTEIEQGGGGGGHGVDPNDIFRQFFAQQQAG